ncbi:hypothetical protein F4777DRAFT_381122 [Nemania sp. FL0916]|nr:hypothetical protein F4777DRAFT_381122 [Nemania sp. FL0916]
MFTSTMLGTGLALLASTRLVAAQSLNLTLTFYLDEDNTCSGNDSKAISFTTSSYPAEQECFNLREIFADNSTGGFRNTSSAIHISPSDVNIRWAITNSEAWDPNGNYSHIKYEQPEPTLQDDDNHRAVRSSRRVNIYNGDSCLQTSNPDDTEDLLPWFGWTCSSSEDDQCRTAPYNIRSFVVIPIVDDADGKCLDFALYGASARSLPHTLGALVAAMAVGFFLL